MPPTFLEQDRLPLAGVKVLDLAHLMQGPWAAEMLADLGADVVKIEHVHGGERGRASGAVTAGGHSAMFLAMNRNKRSIALDLKRPEGLDVALDLVAQADVLIQNFRPGTMERLGLGWEDVHRFNPALVYCSASGYGPRAGARPGQDLLAQARSGGMWLAGTADSPPAPAGQFIADVHSASMLALGALAALHERSRTGRGRLVEVDLVGAMLHQMTQEIVADDLAPGARRGPVPSSPYMEGPYGVYRTADGHLALSICPVPELARALGRPALAEAFPTAEDAAARRDDLDVAVAAVLAERTTAELLDLFESQGIWCAPVNDLAAMRRDPVVGWEDRHVRVAHPEAGEILQVLNPLSLDGARLPVRAAAPLLGEHTDEILTGLDRTPEEVARLRAERVVAGVAR
ncbi:CoA transferase [Georgenia sp. M64]|uniref:CaiB/BaiF CoA transferase family protein n=1 Tax=Georgenia sp. M64 TaxID=3120520 RepID=UPI0030E24AF5